MFFFLTTCQNEKKTEDLRRVVQANRLGECLRQAALIDVYCSLPRSFATSSLAVTTICRFLDTRTSMSAEFRSFLLSMCTGAPESDNKFSFLWLSLGWCWKTPNIRGREEYCFVFIFELVNAFGQFPTISAGTSLLSQCLVLRPFLKFWHADCAHEDEWVE